MPCSKCGHNHPGEKCGSSPAVLQITNKDCTLFHGVTVPAIMGGEDENPPKNGLYKNVLLYYEATGNAYFYTSDGIPYKLTYATTDYNALTNKPTINGVTLEGNKTAANLGIVVNDGTLTLKQGGTVLGTFSANAGEDVEINVADSPLKLAVAYDEEGAWYDGGMPGLNINYSADTLRGDSIGSRIVPGPVTFTDESAGTVYTTEEVFNLLESGRKIVFDSVPLGWYGEVGRTPQTQLVDNVPIGSKVDYGNDGVAYFGGATCPAAVSSRALPLCAAIRKRYIQGGNTQYDLVTQGVDHKLPPE